MLMLLMEESDTERKTRVSWRKKGLRRMEVLMGEGGRGGGEEKQEGGDRITVPDWN